MLSLSMFGGLQQPLGLGWLDGWRDGWINDYSIAIVDAYIASIAIRNKIKGVLQDTQDPRTNC
jgi:hypothetical protein